MKSILAIWLAAATLYAADRQAPPTPAPIQQKLNRDWKRLTSSDLQVIGNASEKDLRRTLREVEAFRRTLAALLPGIRLASSQKTVLIAFRDPSSFQRFAPRDGRGRKQQNVGGYFTVRPDANVMVLPIFGRRETTYEVALHEYTHYLTYRNLRNVPSWLNEGLADFYSTFFVDDDGRCVIGRAPLGRIATLRTRPMWSLSRFLHPETAARLFENESNTLLFYAQAWAFVHYMTLSDNGSRQGQILRYLEALQTAPSQVAAARQAFGADLNQLDSQLDRYVNRDQLPAIVIKVPETQPVVPALEPLTEADAFQVQGRLLADLGASDDAEEVLMKALALEPAHAGARLALGRVRLRQDRQNEGLELLTAVADQHSQDFEAQYYLADALASADRHPESLKAYEQAVSLNRESHFAWFGLSLTAMALKRDSHSEAAMHQVQGLYSDPSWYYTRSRFALGIGRNEAAARDAQEYLKRAGWGDDSAPYAAFIGAIAHWRMKQPAEADLLLAEAARASRPKSWVATVVQYLQNQLAEDAFLDRAKDNGQRTEAHAYIGVRAMAAGRTEDARKHFLWVKERGDRNYTEHGLALAELKRLDGR